MTDQKELLKIIADMEASVSEIKAAADQISGASEKTLESMAELRASYSAPDEPADTVDGEPEKSGTSKEKSGTSPGPVEKAGKTYTKEDVRGFLASIVKKHREEVIGLIKKYGADRLSQIDPKYYAAIMAEAEVLADE